MIKRFKKLICSTGGMTLMELIVGMFVMAIITLAVSTIMLPMYQSYDLAVNMAEVNTILDTVSALVMEDIAGAKKNDVNGNGVEFDNDELIINMWNNAYQIHYYTDEYNNVEGVLMRAIRDSEGVDMQEPQAVLDPAYYRRFNVEIGELDVDEAEGLVTITLSLLYRRTADEYISRNYTARPIAMQ